MLGDAAQVERGLAAADIPTRLALLTALGRYEEAVALGRAEKVTQRDPADLMAWALLARINAAEALTELGHFDEALGLLDFDANGNAFLEAGRRVARAWTLSLAGRDEEALGVIEQASPQQLGPLYEADGLLTWALILLNLGRAEAAQKLAACRDRLARPSTERNLLLLEARWHVLGGCVPDAEAALARAREHRWRRQGATSYLRLGDAFLSAGAGEQARSCWTLGAERDPEAFAAKRCRERLAGLRENAPRA